jgi:hypothetical protein
VVLDALVSLPGAEMLVAAVGLVTLAEVGDGGGAEGEVAFRWGLGPVTFCDGVSGVVALRGVAGSVRLPGVVTFAAWSSRCCAKEGQAP